MKTIAVLLLVFVAVCVRAQPSIGCNDKSKPGKPEELRFLSTYEDKGSTNAAFEWHRPRDASGNGYPSCISEYRVEVLAANGGRANAGTVKVTDPKHTIQKYTAVGLPGGKTYTWTVTPVGPGGIGLTATSASSFNSVQTQTVKPTPL